ncbi:testis-expressed protein 36 [Clarias gariepinus]|uniref:testis-expressed protein 36 n=1 Tax=Clarias gariepinus TaxID=13013 RepID=UPI00234C1BBC|nr:testis-expressed protein 36 [Clarias gariepinus]XP_053365823.1 testis-expressed protein 36 [Clarias gariepinus]
MTKGGKRYANMDQDGRWFAHVDSQQCKVTREACTTTGAMLSQGTSQRMQEQQRFPKKCISHEKKTMSRTYPFSTHDNRSSLQESIETYDEVLGRKKCLDDRRQHKSHFCLCHDGSVCAVSLGSRDNSIYQSDFLTQQNTESTEGTQGSRRFPRNHLKKSQQAAKAQAEERYMWFGRHDMNRRIPLSVLAAANLSSGIPHS